VLKRAAKERFALPLLADQHVSKPLEPWQHGDELMPHGLTMDACLHAWFPPPLPVVLAPPREGASLHANQ
jgi:hypothetical protein